MKQNGIQITYHHAAPGERGRILLVMLPGAGFGQHDFTEHGFVRAVQERGLPVDVAVARPPMDRYLDGAVAGDIEQALIAPARAQGYSRFWFLGISLGGMGALLYARAAPATVEGIILLAPFLGTPGLVSEIARAGGLASWEPGKIAASDVERALLGWLKGFVAAPPAAPRLYLGYARGDRFVSGHLLLAEGLPPDRVLAIDGAHDWAAWTDMWRQMLDKDPFGQRGGAPRAALDQPERL